MKPVGLPLMPNRHTDPWGRIAFDMVKLKLKWVYASNPRALAGFVKLHRPLADAEPQPFPLPGIVAAGCVSSMKSVFPTY